MSVAEAMVLNTPGFKEALPSHSSNNKRERVGVM